MLHVSSDQEFKLLNLDYFKILMNNQPDEIYFMAQISI